MITKLSLVVVGLTIVAACDKGPPTDPRRVADTLSIAGADLIKIKASESFSATKTGSGGPRVVAATWQSDNVSVASIDGSGRATGVGSGLATITADVEGLHATAAVRVVPDYHGRWEGMTRLTGCTADGDFRDACTGAIGSGMSLTTSITQNRDAISGEVDFDGAKGPVSTSVQVDGRIVTTGKLALIVDGIAFDVDLSEWETTSVDNQRMSGRFRLGVRHARLAGSWNLSGELATIQKTSGAPLNTPAPAHRSGSDTTALADRLASVAKRLR